MGNCLNGGKNEIDKPETQTKISNKAPEFRFLLLGSGESGKSTFFKQLKAIFGESIIGPEENIYRTTIYANILNAMILLATHCVTEKTLEDEDLKKEAEDLIEHCKGSNLMMESVQLLTPEVHQTLVNLWADKADDLERLKPPKYTVTDEDALRCRRKTTGIVEFNCTPDIDGKKTNIKIVDVGGQRNERKKWMNYFEGVSAVLFVASLNDFDRTCYEDDVTNRLQESIDLFDEHTNSRFFQDVPIVLFLNKEDLFREKIKKKSIVETFPDYKGEQEFEGSYKYIEQTFLDTNKFNPDRMYVYIAQATDSKRVQTNFNEILSLIQDGKIKQKE
eukprot:gene1132-10646_t